jgi:hypothetical protein
MFKILVFLVAAEPVLLFFRLGLTAMFQGKFFESLPFIALCLMSFSYLIRGGFDLVSELRRILK